MNYQYFDLGSRKKGEIVVVALRGDSMNVRLLDSTNLSLYKHGKKHRYYGGHVTRSPYKVAIPSSGHWHVVIDRGGFTGRTHTSVRVEPAPESRILPPAKSLGDLARIRRAVEEVQTEQGTEPEYDVFISHATEDKDEVVRPLAEALRAVGLRVWYDEYELKVGDSLRRKIDHGLVTSRFGVVVLSKPFFDKGWPQYELDGFVSREMGNSEQLILPIWHNITKDELLRRSPSLVDKVALRTGDLTIEEIAEQIAEAVWS
jgi:hypothetical protein